MKYLPTLFIACSFSILCHAGDLLPVNFPLEFTDSELNREYVKNQRQVVSYKTKLRYTEACDELSKGLGEGWEKKVLSEETAKTKEALLLDPAKPFVGMDTYVNELYPDLTVTIAQVHAGVSGNDYPYFLTITIGPITE